MKRRFLRPDRVHSSGSAAGRAGIRTRREIASPAAPFPRILVVEQVRRKVVAKESVAVVEENRPLEADSTLGMRDLHARDAAGRTVEALAEREEHAPVFNVRRTFPSARDETDIRLSDASRKRRPDRPRAAGRTNRERLGILHPARIKTFGKRVEPGKTSLAILRRKHRDLRHAAKAEVHRVWRRYVVWRGKRGKLRAALVDNPHCGGE